MSADAAHDVQEQARREHDVAGAVEGRPAGRGGAPSPSAITGSCLCGAVGFSLRERPTQAGYCHCTRCQRRTGTSCSAQARVDGAAFTLLRGEEALGAWRHPDGGFEKCFCRVCGSHLFSRSPDGTQMSIRMSAFDEDPGVRPQWRTYVAYAAAWEPLPDDGLERHLEGRPR